VQAEEGEVVVGPAGQRHICKITILKLSFRNYVSLTEADLGKKGNKINVNYHFKEPSEQI
jgi:hypothetical protein